jgi:hypothetical protein
VVAEHETVVESPWWHVVCCPVRVGGITSAMAVTRPLLACHARSTGDTLLKSPITTSGSPASTVHVSPLTISAMGCTSRRRCAALLGL